MKVLYDMSVLGAGYGNPLARTGVFRVVENVALGLTEHPHCQLALTQSLSLENLNFCLGYLETQTDLLRTPFMHSSSALQFYQQAQTLLRQVHYARQSAQLPAAFLNDLEQVLQPLQRVLTNHAAVLYDRAFETVDLFHGSYYPLPPVSRGLPNLVRVLTVYDLIPVLYPEYFNHQKPEDSVVYQALQSLDLERDWVICISEATKQDLCTHLPIDPERVAVTHLAASAEVFYPNLDPAELAQIRQRYNLPEQPYLLCLSTLEPRKNTQQVIQAFLALIAAETLSENSSENESELHLVLVGALGWDYQAILATVQQSPQAQHRVHFVGRVDDQDLAALYSQAIAFVYPSLYEGFGLPPLEAMQCGTPVITSHTSSLPEVVGDAGILVDPHDQSQLCAAILQLYTHPELRNTMQQKSLQQAQKFTWEQCTNQTVSLYEKAFKAQL